MRFTTAIPCRLWKHESFFETVRMATLPLIVRLLTGATCSQPLDNPHVPIHVELETGE